MRFIIAAVVLLCIAVAVYKLGGQGQREGILKDEIETREGIDDAHDICPDNPDWLERLRCHNAQ